MPKPRVRLWDVQVQAPTPCWSYFEVESFRGFRGRIRLELDATAVIVTGANGTGKTSLFDGLQWLLLGDIPRLKSLRHRTTEEHIVNAYSRGPARIRAELRVHGRNLLLERSGDRSGSDFQLIDNEELLTDREAAVRLDELLTTGLSAKLEEVLFSSAMLQQDDVRHVLAAEPGERFEQMSRLLGLADLEGFQTAAQSEAKASSAELREAREEAKAGQASLETARSARLEAEREQASLPMATALMEALTKELSSYQGVLSFPLPLNSDDVTALAGACRSLESDLSQALELRRLIRSAPPDLESLPDLTGSHIEAVGEMQAIAERLAATRGAIAALAPAREAARASANALARLAEVALPLLADLCPVCGQAIHDIAQTAEDLRSRASDGHALQAISEQWDTRSRELSTLEQQHAQAVEAVNGAAERMRLGEMLSIQRGNLSARLSAIDETPVIHPTSRISEASDNDQEPRLQDLTRVTTEVRLRLDATLGSLASLERGSRLASLGARVADAQHLAGTRQRLEESAAKASRADSLAKATTRARQQVIQRRLDVLRPLVDDIYTRLDPHPTFRGFRFESDVLRNKGTLSPRVFDEQEGVTVNPSLAFSSAQINMVALTYFLALAWSTGDRALPFISLDDPLQEMDDVNVLAFSDLARHLRSDRQILVATHERRYASLLKRKLAPRMPGETTRLISFNGWSRRGPVLEQEVVEYNERVGALRLLA